MKSFKQYLAEIFGEPEDSNFTHEDHTYDLNGLLSATVGNETVQMPTAKLRWIMRYDPMMKEDEPRIQSADLSAPLLIIKDAQANDQWVVLDGIHRLAKAIREHVADLPCIIVSNELLERYKIA